MFDSARVGLKFLTRYVPAACLLLVLTAAAGQAAPLPIADKEVHMGVATCAGSTCHGAVDPLPGIGILQNEYITWQRHDQHAKAYQVLLGERSKRIAKNLGLEAAEKSAMCLDCHADNSAQRHRTFQISDGVSCEACHGGAGRWIGTHIAANASHKNNIANGLYPSANPTDRAKLCLSCHFGDETRFVTHKIMGAGHPRMSFELDTFTAIMPAHFKADADYRKRKGSWNGVQVWAIGQAMSIGTLLDAMLDPKRNSDGIFPELVLFDCQSCHHRMSNLRWEASMAPGLGPGIPRISDSNLLMLSIIASRVDAALGKELHARMVALQQATRTSREAMMTEAKALKAITDKLVEAFSAHSFGKADMQALLAGVVESGLARQFLDYSDAEQAAMAVSTIITAMRQTGAIDKGQYDALKGSIDKCYEAVAKDEEFNADAFIAALEELKSKIPSG